MMLRPVLLLSLLCLPSWSKEQLQKGLLERIIQPKVTFESSYLADADIKGSEGSVEVHKNRLRVNNEIIGLSYTHWAFSWDDLHALPFGDQQSSPITQMHAFKLNANLPFFINKKWFLLTSASIRSAFEKNTKDSYGAGLFSFASYKIDDDHTIQLGAFANYHKVSTLALPVISYSYRARQNDGLQVILGFPRTYIAYHANESTLFKLGIIYSQSVIKLSNESTIENSGFIEAKDYMGNIGATYRFNQHLKCEANILYSIRRDFTIFDSLGKEHSSYSIEPSIGLNAKIVWLF